MSHKKIVYTRSEMLQFNIEMLKKRGVSIESIAEIAYHQQKRYSPNVTFELCMESVEKLLSLRDIFHHVQLAAEIDRLAEVNAFEGPIQDIIYEDLGLFGIDEVLGLDVAGTYGAIGQTNFGDIDVNKAGIVRQLNDQGKKDGSCHTFLDDIVGAIAAAASTRVAQVTNENDARDANEGSTTIFDLMEE